jgi:hypothetical protein
LEIEIIHRRSPGGSRTDFDQRAGGFFEIAAAIGNPNGLMHRMLQEDRDWQIAAVATWLAVGDGPALH